MKRIIVVPVLVLVFALFSYAETLPSSVTSVFSSQVGVDFYAFPQGQIDFYSQYPNAKFVDEDHVEIGEPVLVLVDDAAKLTDLINHQNFTCQKDDVVMVKFKSQAEVAMTLPELEGKMMTVTLVFNDKTEEWELK